MDWTRMRRELTELYKTEIKAWLEDDERTKPEFYVDTPYSDDFDGWDLNWISSCWFEPDNEFVEVILYHADHPCGQIWNCITVDLIYTLEELIDECRKELKEAREYD